MKVLSAEQIRSADNYTIENEPISSIDLMERASKSFCEIFTVRYPQELEVAIICGKGNNGGDGLAIARLLSENGYNVEVYVFETPQSGSPDYETNLARLPSDIPIIHLESDSPRINFDDKIVVDAIFGSGLTRPLEGVYKDIVEIINSGASEVVSVDIPSGVYCDEGIGESVAVNANLTVSFQAPKLAFLMPDNAAHVEDWVVADIGLDEAYIGNLKTEYYVSDRQEIEGLMRKRPKFSHKGTYGHCLIMAGSKGKMGAAVLATRACLRSGVGLATAHVPEVGGNILQITVPEAMLSIDQDLTLVTSMPDLTKYTALAIGPGLGTATATTELLKQVLSASNSPMVLDADALNIISQNREILELLPRSTIITPHPKEFDRLAGSSNTSWERLEKAKSFAIRYGLVVVLKGAHTAVISPDKQVWFNNTGNPGMATAGSGDVLTGIISSFLAQSYPAHEAAVIGVFIHGMAGDMAAESKGLSGLIASDIIEHIPPAIKTFE